MEGHHPNTPALATPEPVLQVWGASFMAQYTRGGHGSSPTPGHLAGPVGPACWASRAILLAGIVAKLPKLLPAGDNVATVSSSGQPRVAPAAPGWPRPAQGGAPTSGKHTVTSFSSKRQHYWFFVWYTCTILVWRGEGVTQGLS